MIDITAIQDFEKAVKESLSKLPFSFDIKIKRISGETVNDLPERLFIEIHSLRALMAEVNSEAERNELNSSKAEIARYFDLYRGKTESLIKSCGNALLKEYEAGPDIFRVWAITFQVNAIDRAKSNNPYPPKEYMKYLFFLLKEMQNQIPESKTKVFEGDPLEMIEISLRARFSKMEERALSKSGKWESKIRCAAFLELLFDKKYFTTHTERIRTCNAFAMSRYGKDVKNQLAGTAKKDRDTHKNKLKYLFE